MTGNGKVHILINLLFENNLVYILNDKKQHVVYHLYNLEMGNSKNISFTLIPQCPSLFDNAYKVFAVEMNTSKAAVTCLDTTFKNVTLALYDSGFVSSEEHMEFTHRSDLFKFQKHNGKSRFTVDFIFNTSLLLVCWRANQIYRIVLFRNVDTEAVNRHTLTPPRQKGVPFIGHVNFGYIFIFKDSSYVDYVYEVLCNHTERIRETVKNVKVRKVFPRLRLPAGLVDPLYSPKVGLSREGGIMYLEASSGNWYQDGRRDRVVKIVRSYRNG
jgi:hypothetical protein